MNEIKSYCVVCVLAIIYVAFLVWAFVLPSWLMYESAVYHIYAQ